MVGCCRRSGRDTNKGSRSLICKAAAAFSLKLVEVLKFVFFLPASHLRVTGRLIFEHGHTVRFVTDGFGTVRMCVAGGVDANVYTCFSVGGTGMNGVIVRLFFNPGCIVDPRVVLIFCFSPGGSGCWSFCPAALSLLRGFGAAWSSVLEAWTCLVSLSVLWFLRFSSPCPRFCVVLLWSWGLPPSWAGFKYGAYHAGMSAIFSLSWLLVVAPVPGGVEVRGSHGWHINKIFASADLLGCSVSVGNVSCLLACFHDVSRCFMDAQ